ncbi:MAG: hypothetical protein ACK4ZJ_16435, partial [Allorhizobium sp.]
MAASAALDAGGGLPRAEPDAGAAAPAGGNHFARIIEPPRGRQRAAGEEPNISLRSAKLSHCARRELKRLSSVGVLDGSCASMACTSVRRTVA